MARRRQKPCAHPGCGVRPCFNLADEVGGLFCKTHKSTEMVNVVTTNRCAHEGCGVVPTFNVPDQATGLFCVTHKSTEMVDVVTVRRCAHDGCGVRPSFNLADEVGGLFCKKHKSAEMVDVMTKRRCAHDGCGVTPSFNLVGQAKGLYCKTHKDTEMVYVVTKRRCAHDGCGVVPKFNLVGQAKGLYCKKHKSTEMVDVLTTSRCAHDGCGVVPSFNLAGQAKGLFCKKHKSTEMVDVVTTRCAHDGCGVVPNFNLAGQAKGLYCKKHKSTEMVDIMHRRQCAHDGCEQKQPQFNMPDQKMGLYCARHKLDGMIGIQSKKCQARACREPAAYGKDEFHRAQFCEAHKLESSVCIADALLCTHAAGDERCTKHYEFVVETEAGAQRVCLAHAPPGYEATMKGLCKYCDIRDDVPLVCRSCKQRMHKKEHAVVRHLRRVIDCPLIYDESPGFECTRKRPDIRFEMPTHDVIVEVDENQHRGYAESCECARIAEIVGAIGGKSVVLIRYNPDAVKFGGRQHDVTAAERIDLLVATVNEEIARVPTKFEVRLVQLWFDAPTADPKREMDITSIVAV